jgi:hypothetical protein
LKSTKIVIDAKNQKDYTLTRTQYRKNALPCFVRTKVTGNTPYCLSADTPSCLSADTPSYLSADTPSYLSADTPSCLSADETSPDRGDAIHQVPLPQVQQLPAIRSRPGPHIRPMQIYLAGERTCHRTIVKKSMRATSLTVHWMPYYLLAIQQKHI